MIGMQCRWQRCQEQPVGSHYCGLHRVNMERRLGSRVYFIEAGNFVKIGVSNNPQRRIRELRYDSPAPEGIPSAAMRILAVEPGGWQREARLHVIFSAHRVKDEWFRKSPELLDYIARLSSVDREESAVDTAHLSALISAAAEAHSRSKVKMGRNPSAATRERNEALRAARAAGVRAADLARALGVRPKRITQILSK